MSNEIVEPDPLDPTKLDRRIIAPFQATQLVGHGPWFHASFTMPTGAVDAMSTFHRNKFYEKYPRRSAVVFVADDSRAIQPPPEATVLENESFNEGDTRGVAWIRSIPDKWYIEVHRHGALAYLGYIPFGLRPATPEEIAEAQAIYLKYGFTENYAGLSTP